MSRKNQKNLIWLEFCKEVKGWYYAGGNQNMWNFVYFDEIMANIVGNFQLGLRCWNSHFVKKDQSGCLRRDAFKEGTNGDAEIIQEIIIIGVA